MSEVNRTPRPVETFDRTMRGGIRRAPVMQSCV